MSEQPLDEAKRRIKIEQVVRDFFMVLDQHHLTLEEGLVAWNMLGFTTVSYTHLTLPTTPYV